MTIEDIATKICDKYSLTIDLSVPIADAIKQSQIFTPINEDIPESEGVYNDLYSRDVIGIDSFGHYHIVFYNYESSVFCNSETDEALTDIIEWREIELI